MNAVRDCFIYSDLFQNFKKIYYHYPYSDNWKISKMIMYYFSVSKLESIVSTSIHIDLLTDGLCMKVTLVSVKCDDDFMTWAFRNNLMKLKKKKKVLPNIFCSIWDYF